MPLYEYQCEKCERVSEVIQKFADAPLELCPFEGCGGHVRKLMSSTSFALKGSGWYTTDYKRASKPAAAPAAAPTEKAAAPTPAKPAGEKT